MDEVQIRRAENQLFFRRWLKNPRQLGTLAPISVKLSMKAAKAAILNYKPGMPVVEIGAGTGRLTRALLACGVRPEDLTVVELDAEMCSFLQKTVPNINVIQGNALNLETLISQENLKKVAVVVSAIPFMYLKEKVRMDLMEAAFSILKPQAKVIHVTYNPRSPLSFWKNIHQTRVANAWFNLPPGFVWQFAK